MPTLFAQVLVDAHRYAPGVDAYRPTKTADTAPTVRRLGHLTREYGRDLFERAAAAVGLHRRHFRPEVTAERLARLLELADGFETTYSRLSDEQSRRALVAILKLRLLGPQHAPLATTPSQFRARQAQVEQRHCLQPATRTVSDPWFSPLSLYRVPVNEGGDITLHCHSVDLVSVFALGQYSYVHDDVCVRVEEGDVVLDVGGCWGDTALRFASLVGPSGKVYTFEFDPESVEVLRTNLALNPELAARVEIVEKALWSRSGEVLTVHQAGRCTSVDTPTGEKAMTVETITLDDFVEGAGVERVGFIKMDVEGAEPLVMDGAVALLRTDRPIILSELHPTQLERASGISADGFLAAMRSLGYQAHLVEHGLVGAPLDRAPAAALVSVVLLPM